jgi:hypothetical protein
VVRCDSNGRKGAERVQSLYLPANRIAVLGDHQLLCEVIEFVLKLRFRVQVIRAPLSEPLQRTDPLFDELDLVILTHVSCTGEPLPVLEQEALGVRLGQVPLLIISPQPLNADPNAGMVHHLLFPFTHDELCDKIAAILTCRIEALVGKGASR